MIEEKPQFSQGGNMEARSEQQRHEDAYRFLSNLPEGLGTSDAQLKEWAKKYNETICIPVTAQQTEKFWVVYYDGKESKIAPIVNPGERPRAYLVYHSNGTVQVSQQPMGIEVKSATPFKKTE